jgi:HPt (histidine-containing phosphotransfer) domain-containing protein
MTPSQFQYLSTQRVAEFIGDSAGVNRLLGTLKETLDNDLPALRQRLDQGDIQGVNDLLHQFKGFAPVFCVDALVEQVVRVESISKNATVDELRSALLPLLEQLAVLKAEVDRQLAGA